jgi:tetratricopeptide (TPR) repeat protein
MLEILAGPGDVTGQAKQIAEEFQAHNENNRALVVLNATIDWIHSPAADRVARAAGSDSSEFRSSILLREGALLLMAGRLSEARDAFTRFLPEAARPRERQASQTICSACGWDVASVRSYVALVAAHQGDRALADSVILELERSPSSMLAGGLGLYMAARIAAALGDRERAVRDLTEALRNPDNADLLLYVHREREWFALRNYEPFAG